MPQRDQGLCNNLSSRCCCCCELWRVRALFSLRAPAATIREARVCVCVCCVLCSILLLLLLYNCWKVFTQYGLLNFNTLVVRRSRSERVLKTHLYHFLNKKLVFLLLFLKNATSLKRIYIYSRVTFLCAFNYNIYTNKLFFFIFSFLHKKKNKTRLLSALCVQYAAEGPIHLFRISLL